MWYTLAGALLTVVVGVVASRARAAAGVAHVPPAPRLLAPCVRRMCREPPHPTDEPFIRAYGNKVSYRLFLSSHCIMQIAE